jgi:hypothetical protein
MIYEPTVEQMVTQIMGLGCGDTCDITLNPKITRVDNVTWLLPICVTQFGTRISIDQHAQDSSVVLTITATASRKRNVRERVVAEQPTLIEVRERVIGQPLPSAGGREPASAAERETAAVA